MGEIAPALDLKPTDPHGWLLYDGACGFCSRWIPFWSGYVRKHGYEIAPLQDRDLQARFALDEAHLLREMTLILANGRQIRGADVYRHFLRLSWACYPVYLLTQLPGVRQLFNWGYQTFARNRYRLAGACPVPAKNE